MARAIFPSDFFGKYQIYISYINQLLADRSGGFNFDLTNEEARCSSSEVLILNL